MKIWLDSKTLSLGYLSHEVTHRTGIFRYADNIAKHLMLLPEIELTFYSVLAQKEEAQWQETLNKLPQFKNANLYNKPHPLRPCFDQLSEKIKQSLGIKKFGLKRVKESLRLLMQVPLFSFIKKNDYDIFYSPYHPIPQEIQSRKDIVCFTTIHDLIPIKYPEYFKIDKRKFFDAILKNPKENHFFFALSEATKKDIYHYYSVDPDKIIVTPSAVQEGLFYPVKELDALQKVQKKHQIKRPYILSVATIEPRKNIKSLVKAYASLLDKTPSLDFDLVLCGARGWEINSLFDQIKKHSDRIIVTGFVDDSDLAALYSGALAFVYPSFYEGFGLPPLESMSCGTPVIVSNTSSLPEVVGDAGLYVDPNNIDDIADKIMQLVSSQALREDLRKLGFARAKQFNWEQNAQQIYQSFERALTQVR